MILGNIVYKQHKNLKFVTFSVCYDDIKGFLNITGHINNPPVQQGTRASQTVVWDECVQTSALYDVVLWYNPPRTLFEHVSIATRVHCSENTALEETDHKLFIVKSSKTESFLSIVFQYICISMYYELLGCWIKNNENAVVYANV